MSEISFFLDEIPVKSVQIPVTEKKIWVYRGILFFREKGWDFGGSWFLPCFSLFLVKNVEILAED